MVKGSIGFVCVLALAGCSRLHSERDTSGQWILERYDENGSYQNRTFTFRKDGVNYRAVPYEDSCNEVLKYMHRSVPLTTHEGLPLRLDFTTSSTDPDQHVCSFKIVEAK